ncbi:MAG: nucleotidyltransferase domain-containing protein [Candidatus Thorarchaeota archaeon]
MCREGDGYNSLILEPFLPLTLSIMLVGSQVNSENRSDSDIDLIAIGEHPQKLRKLILESNQHLSGGVRPKLDLKTFTQQDFVKRISEKENFYFWTCSQHRRVLHGSDLLDNIQLIPQMVDNLIWNQVEQLQESIEWLEMNKRYTGSCFYIYEYLATSYFLERFVLESRKVQSLKKGEYLKRILNDLYGTVKQKYYAVVKKEPPFRVSRVVKIKGDTDRNVRPEDYFKLQLMNTDILNNAEEIKKRIGKWVDS